MRGFLEESLVVEFIVRLGFLSSPFDVDRTAKMSIRQYHTCSVFSIFGRQTAIRAGPFGPAQNRSDRESLYSHLD